MSQRVNIQYSVGIEELPDEVNRIAAKALSALHALAEDNKSLAHTPLSLETHNQVDTLRRELASLDASLADLNTIIGSYLSYKANQLMQDPAASTPTVPDFDPTQLQGMENPLSELQQKIAHFKQSLAAEEGADDQPNQG